jgi:hypothetical protein
LPEPVTIEPFCEAEWESVLRFANTVAPYSAADNREWLENRRRFDTTALERRHYGAREPSQGLVGYGAVEARRDAPRVYRMFIVPARVDLWDSVGEQLYVRLKADLGELGARAVWLREYEEDEALLQFFAKHGFVTTASYSSMTARSGFEPELRAIGFHVAPREGMTRVIVRDSDTEVVRRARALGFERETGYVTLEKTLRE